MKEKLQKQEELKKQITELNEDLRDISFELEENLDSIKAIITNLIEDKGVIITMQVTRDNYLKLIHGLSGAFDSPGINSVNLEMPWRLIYADINEKEIVAMPTIGLEDGKKI